MLVSIAIPVYEMDNKDFFLERCLDSIRQQSYQDWEIVITEDGKMAENTNSAIKQSYGDLIKILYMDDFFAHKDSLKNIVAEFTKDVNWLVTGCIHTHGADRFNPHYAMWNKDIHTTNTIGSPSVITIRNTKPELFDETLTWMLDADYYKRLYNKFGQPKILNDLNVVIGIGDHQATSYLSDEVKEKEYRYMVNKYL